MREKNLKENIEFVKKNREQFLREYFYKYLLVYRESVIDSFDTYEKAAEEGVRKFGIDENFLVYHLVETEPLNFVYNAVL
ncbi:MAG: hypothetical protein QG657_4326 [Acidobacteriota bacterium]|nr:hypothetical protein [Acidobacteriota bacterium]